MRVEVQTNLEESKPSMCAFSGKAWAEARKLHKEKMKKNGIT